MRAVVVGSGAGGAAAARELAGRGAQVIVLEAGKEFRPLRGILPLAGLLRPTGILGSERTIRRFFPPLQTIRSGRELVLVRGVTTGGSTVVSCGNMVRAERGLREIGLDLSPEFGELERILGAEPVPEERWRPLTREMFEVAGRKGLNPAPTPKAVDMGRCISCGLCELGCAAGAKWDARRFFGDITAGGGEIRTGSPVQRIMVEGGRARGVRVAGRNGAETVRADAVVLAAGGVGTPQLLRASGLQAEDNLWVDVVLTMGGRSRGARQLEELPMVWYARRGDYILSPYLDVLSHWFHRPWRDVPVQDRVGMMVKLADMPGGRVEADGTVCKSLTDADRGRLDEGTALAREIMEEAGVGGPFTEGMLHGGHLGGAVPLRRGDVESMHPGSLPEGLWVADLSLLPSSQGMPTMLVTAALAMRVARRVAAASRQGTCGEGRFRRIGQGKSEDRSEDKDGR